MLGIFMQNSKRISAEASMLPITRTTLLPVMIYSPKLEQLCYMFCAKSSNCPSMATLSLNILS